MAAPNPAPRVTVENRTRPFLREVGAAHLVVTTPHGVRIEASRTSGDVPWTISHPGGHTSTEVAATSEPRMIYILWQHLRRCLLTDLDDLARETPPCPTA